METVFLTKSRVRQELLGQLFLNPAKRYYLSELARLARTSAGNVQRELTRLVREGWVFRQKQGKFAFYTANPDHELFPEIHALVRKTCGLEGKLRAYFQAQPEVQLAYLFGSQATGRANRLSDVDVGILVDPAQVPPALPYGYKAEIGAELMSLLKTHRVDVVLLNEAPVFLQHQVLKSGRCVFAKDPKLRIRFEATVISRYPDLHRLFQQYRAWKKAA